MRILIAEDESVTARRLERMVGEILGEKAESVTVKESLADAEEHLFGKPIDLLLLDLNLHGEDGYSLLKLAAAGSFQTIVVSANSDRAVEAFQYGVLDFVPKPFDLERLKKALDRVNLKGPGQSPAKYLSVRKHGKVELVPVEKVRYLQGAGDYVEIHLDDGRMELHSKTLEALAGLLPPHFERIHKSYIADMRAMKGIVLQGAGKYVMELPDGRLLPISRTKYKELKERV
ncbi:MAG: transcriptional regulator, LytTR family [Fibrobacteres bacterium]|nr:transcriptional regulator, LytTR family [Fibrobacterota bacterium]